MAQLSNYSILYVVHLLCHTSNYCILSYCFSTF